MALTEQEMFVKDAFLVFRALCKLTMKPLLADSYVRPRLSALDAKRKGADARSHLSCS